MISAFKGKIIVPLIYTHLVPMAPNRCFSQDPNDLFFAESTPLHLLLFP